MKIQKIIKHIFTRIKYVKLFKSDWYRRSNKDVDFSDISPFKHYKKYGWKQGRAPSPFFNEDRYQVIAPDFQKGSRNPIEDAIDRLKSKRIKRSDLKRLLGTPPEAYVADPLKDGMSISGYLKSEVGLGQAARNLVAAIDKAEIPSTLHDLPLKNRDSDTSYIDRVQEIRDRKINVIVIAVPEIPTRKYEIRSGVKSILYPFWELSKIPENLKPYIDQYDEIWAPSQFIATMFLRYNKKVTLVRQPVITPVLSEIRDGGKSLKLLTYYDFDSFISRKNIKAPIIAFQKAFPSNQDVSLTVKARGKDDRGAREWLKEKADGDPRINIIDKTVTRSDVERLIMECDVFISLHRSEGFGFGAAEALAAGKAVVSTDYSGTTDFINHETGYPVSYDIIPVKEGDYPHWQNQVWADPHLDSAVEALRRIYENREEAVKKGIAGRNLIIEKYSPAVIGAQIKKLLSIQA